MSGLAGLVALGTALVGVGLLLICVPPLLALPAVPARDVGLIRCRHRARAGAVTVADLIRRAQTPARPVPARSPGAGALPEGGRA